MPCSLVNCFHPARNRIKSGPFLKSQIRMIISHNVTERGLALVRHFEGLYLKAYPCEAGVWTIGYGHTGLQHKDGTVFHGRVITETEALKLLEYDLNQFEARVKALVKVPLSGAQFDALVSFDFNTGALHKSTVLKRLNAGDYSGAADALLMWTRAGGKVQPGLVRRRKAERHLFLTGELKFKF